MNNVIYFSGSHGAGKTTLIKKLVEKEPELFVIHKKLELPKSEYPFERQKLRLARYYWDATAQDKFSKNNKNKVLFCDRSVTSSLVYVKSLYELGWLTEKQKDECRMLYEELFHKNIKPKNIIFLNPSLEETIQNIKKRWKETGKKKWKEDNFEYLKTVKENFEELYKNNDLNILELNFMDLEKRIETSYNWITGGCS